MFIHLKDYKDVQLYVQEFTVCLWRSLYMWGIPDGLKEDVEWMMSQHPDFSGFSFSHTMGTDVNEWWTALSRSVNVNKQDNAAPDLKRESEGGSDVRMWYMMQVSVDFYSSHYTARKMRQGVSHKVCVALHAWPSPQSHLQCVVVCYEMLFGVWTGSLLSFISCIVTKKHWSSVRAKKTIGVSHMCNN